MRDDEEIIRACAACLAPLLPKMRAYCCRECRRAVRLWRLKAEVAR